ncbi:mucin-1-like [Indicator indicator]|uniref:mucin-1-like n=1 Tax=Indicator indicator TaxID=1002788 RepID=UPI0023DEC2E2|nr:mucin-1-like [Indicator indicator]
MTQGPEPGLECSPVHTTLFIPKTKGPERHPVKTQSGSFLCQQGEVEIGKLVTAFRYTPVSNGCSSELDPRPDRPPCRLSLISSSYSTASTPGGKARFCPPAGTRCPPPSSPSQDPAPCEAGTAPLPPSHTGAPPLPALPAATFRPTKRDRGTLAPSRRQGTLRCQQHSRPPGSTPDRHRALDRHRAPASPPRLCTAHRTRPRSCSPASEAPQDIGPPAAPDPQAGQNPENEPAHCPHLPDCSLPARARPRGPLRSGPKVPSTARERVPAARSRPPPPGPACRPRASLSANMAGRGGGSAHAPGAVGRGRGRDPGAGSQGHPHDPRLLSPQPPYCVVPAQLPFRLSVRLPPPPRQGPSATAGSQRYGRVPAPRQYHGTGLQRHRLGRGAQPLGCAGPAPGRLRYRKV